MIACVEDHRLQLVDRLEDGLVLHVLRSEQVRDEAFPWERRHHHQAVFGREVGMIPHEVKEE